MPAEIAAITRFEGKYMFLSNFYLHPVEYKSFTYRSAEHAYQSQKTEDPFQRERINFICSPLLGGTPMLPTAPGQAKRIGGGKSSVVRIDLRLDWNEIKVQVMREVLLAKFQDSKLQEQLLATEDIILIEGNYRHDQFWGRCGCLRCSSGTNSSNGENLLGRLLIETRQYYRLT